MTGGVGRGTPAHLAFGVFAGMLCAASSLVVIAAGCPENLRVAVFAATVGSSVILPIIYRNNSVLFVITLMMAYANYSACMVNTFPPYNGYDTIYAGSQVSILGMATVLLFNGVLLAMVPREVLRYGGCGLWGSMRSRYSLPLVLIVCALLVVVFFTCSSGFTPTGGRAWNNSIFEYSYVLFILGFLIVDDSKLARGALLAMAGLYIAQAFFGGNRASVLAIVLLLYMIYIAPRVDWKASLLIIFLGVLFMQAIGYFRYSDGVALFRIGDALSRTVANGMCWDTATYAFHQGIAFLRLDEVIPLDQRLYLLRQWVLSWFVGSGSVPDSALSVYCMGLYPGLGGGFLTQYGYFYLGAPGVVLMGVVVGLWFRGINGISAMCLSLKAVLCVAIAVTFCRWYLYSPAPFTSGCVFMTICYALTRLTCTAQGRRRPVVSVDVLLD